MSSWGHIDERFMEGRRRHNLEEHRVAEARSSGSEDNRCWCCLHRRRVGDGVGVLFLRCSFLLGSSSSSTATVTSTSVCMGSPTSIQLHATSPTKIHIHVLLMYIYEHTKVKPNGAVYTHDTLNSVRKFDVKCTVHECPHKSVE